jgi:hypothetical protein
MEEWWMTTSESVRQAELLRNLSYPGSAALAIITAVCVVSTALALLWLLAVQRYVLAEAEGVVWGRGR